MDLMKILDAVLPWRWNVADPSTKVFVLNTPLGMPTTFPTEKYAGGPESELYLFEYNYMDRAKALASIASLETLRRTQNLDFSGKTLLLAAKGLHPLGDELLNLARQFRAHHVFFELWNGLKEVVELAEAHLEHLYFLPVTNRLLDVGSPRVPSTPNANVFVSLGGDDALDLIREVVARCPGLHFFIPTVSWAKPGSDKSFFDVTLPAANVTSVDCSPVKTTRQLSFSPEYRAAYAACDTVLIATTADKMFQLRGGVRFADALYARKHIVITENPMCQLLMAEHGRTCLVAEHRADAVAAQLMRIGGGDFQVVESLYEDIRQLTLDQAKLDWMVEAGRAPEVARRSVFARGDDLLDVARRSLFSRGRDLLEREVREVRGC